MTVSDSQDDGGLDSATRGVPVTRQALRSRVVDALQRSKRESPAILQALGRRPSSYVFALAWFASVTALGEIAYLTYSKEITGYKVIGFEFMYLVPWGYLLLHGALMLFVLRPGVASFRTAMFLAAFVMFAALVPIAIKGLYYWALLVLAAGAAVQLTRIVSSYASVAYPLIRRTALPAAAIALLMAVMFASWPIIAEQRALNQLPPAQSTSPNIVLIVLDTVRASSLSLYGYHRKTSPRLEQFAKRAVTFERAYSTSPWTLPSHGSMFTGRLPHELSGRFGKPIDARYPTVAEVLGRHGYLTAGFVANTWYGGAEFGLARGFQHYEDDRSSTTTALMSTSVGRDFLKATGLKERWATHENFGRKSAEYIGSSFGDWLDRRDANRPFFAFLNFCDAHAPYASPKPFATRFSAKGARGDVWARRLDGWSEAEIRDFNDAYDGAIAYIDEHVGRIIAALAARRALRNTVIIVTSDHGEQFGEHNLVEHVNSLYLPLLHVPLVIAAPQGPAGLRVTTPVSLRDLAASILDFAGVRDATVFPGAPLLPHDGPQRGGAEPVLLAEVERASEAYPESYPARKGRMKSVLSPDWQYIRNFGDGREELYHLPSDPETMRNLSMTFPDRLQEYRGHLARLTAPSVAAYRGRTR
jgi:arylsulfatase A-like enzyme